MIEGIAAGAKALAEAVAIDGKEGSARLGVGGLSGARQLNESGRFGVGGNFRSILSALEVDPSPLGREVLGNGWPGVETSKVPLLDSKGDVRHMVSPQEVSHYQSIGLRAAEVNQRPCLVRGDIDWQQKDTYGQTNRERASQGLAPLDSAGRPYELHHVEQKSTGMLAELTRDEHRGPAINGVLHDPSKTSEINRAEFDTIKAEHWKARAAEVTP